MSMGQVLKPITNEPMHGLAHKSSDIFELIQIQLIVQIQEA